MLQCCSCTGCVCKLAHEAHCLAVSEAVFDLMVLIPVPVSTRPGVSGGTRSHERDGLPAAGFGRRLVSSTSPVLAYPPENHAPLAATPIRLPHAHPQGLQTVTPPRLPLPLGCHASARLTLTCLAVRILTCTSVTVHCLFSEVGRMGGPFRLALVCHWYVLKPEP